MRSTRSDWLIPGALIALSLVPAIAGTARLAQLAGGASISPENARFFAAPVPVLLHIPAVILFSMLGAFQFSPGFRRRRNGWHRAAGRILIPCGLVAALSGLWMTCVYPWPPGDGQPLYVERLVFGSAMVLSIVLSVLAIRRRDFVSHGQWMLRAYAIGLGAGTQVLTHLPWFLLVGAKPGERPRAMLMGAGWVINVVVAEWIIRRRRAHPVAVMATAVSRESEPPRGVRQPSRFHVFCLAPLLGAAVTTPQAAAQASTHVRVVASAPPAARLTTRVRASEVEPAIPRTPAGDALRAWIEAFNSADAVRPGAYARRYEPEVVIGDELAFREQTGGFDLLAIERSTLRHVAFIVRERRSPMTAYGVIVVPAVDPVRVTARRVQPLGPNITAAALRLDAATQARTLATVAALLDTFYVSPDVATRAADVLRARGARGAYREYANGVSFAMRLDDDMAELTRDKHLHVLYSVRPLPPDASTAIKGTSSTRSPDDARREQARMDGMNCGFTKVEVLAGNVGYVKYDLFADPEVCRATASAAMTFVAGTRALILDLRDNGGGEPAMVSYIASYLFDARTHLNDLWTRRTGTTKEFWTRDSVPGRRFGGAKPVYVLTSSRTFSGGEEFTYDLQQLKRATIVGETTGGGAHPMSSHRINEHFMITVPLARPVNPVTHTNWEGVGVKPDVKVPAGNALATAQQRLRLQQMP